MFQQALDSLPQACKLTEEKKAAFVQDIDKSLHETQTKLGKILFNYLFSVPLHSGIFPQFLFPFET